MAIELPGHVYSDAIRRFWGVRQAQASKQEERGVADQGKRSQVTGGKQLDGVLETTVDYLLETGLGKSNISTGRSATYLPGFFRPVKGWDLLVTYEDELLAVIEFKSQVGPSFGNNFNNRTEEAMGSSLDLWTAYREGAFDDQPEPWLGYFFVLEDTEKSRSSVRVFEPHFEVFDEFRGASYQDRYQIFCTKLVRERQYSSACLLLTAEEDAEEEENYRPAADHLSGEKFLKELISHVRSSIDRLE